MKNFIKWMESLHAPIWVDFIRIGVGIFIVYKGLYFANNFASFQEHISSVGWVFVAAHVAQVIIFVHLVCGPILVLGAYTRVMSLLNIPILLGAVVFNYKKMLTADNYMELPMAIVLLILLVVIFIMGGGRLSLDRKKEVKIT